MLKKLKTDRLFYGKYPYKISTRLQGASSSFRFMNLFKEIAQRIPGSRIKYEDFDTYAKVFIKYDDTIRYRIESNSVNFFTADKEVYDSLLNDLSKYVVSVTEPESKDELDVLNTKNKIVLCDYYPHDIYKYKVTFKANTDQLKKTLLNWHKTYPETTIKFSKKTIENLSSDRSYYWQYSFLYVKDEKFLSMLYLLGNGYIKRVEEYVIRSSINTVSQDSIDAEMG